MAERDDTRLCVFPPPEFFLDLLGRKNGGGDRLLHVSKAPLLRKKAPGPVGGPIFMVGGEDLIPGSQIQRVRNDIQGDGYVLRIDQIIRLGTEVICQRFSRSVHELVMTTSQKLDGLAFELALPVLIRCKYASGRRPKRTMIEKNDTGIK